MGRRAVIAFARVFHDEFPVGLLDQAALIRHFGLAQPVRSEQWCNGGFERSEIRHIVRQGGVNAACHQLNPEWKQAVIVGFEFGRHPRGAEEPAVQVISPLMVGTDQLRATAMSVGADLRSAMPAYIVKAADEAIAPTDQQHRVPADRDGHIGSAFRQLRFEADHEPRSTEDAGHVEIEQIRIRVERLRQRVARLRAAKQVQNSTLIYHAGRRVDRGLP